MCNRYIGGDHWGASSYISDDNLVYTRTEGSKLTYTIDVPTDGRYELNFIYGNGEGTTRNTPETSLSKNLYQDMEVDGEYRETLTMNNTLLTNTTGAKRVFLDLTEGEHTISLTSKQDGELLHDLLVVKYKGEYGKDIVFDKTYEGEDADFNELIGNTTTVTTNSDGDGTTYITGLAAKKVTEGGGARQSVVVRESGMYNLEFTIPEGEDSALISLESDSDIWLTHIVIRAEAKGSEDQQVLFRDDFSEDTSAEYDIPNLKSASCEWGTLDVNMNSDWDETNGIRRDITEFVSGHSGEELSVSLDAGYFAEGDINVSFEVCGSDGIAKETIPAASAVSTSDGTKVNVAGSAVVSFEEGDSVYLVVTHPSGFHSYDNIVVSVKNVPAISSSSDLSTAYSTGGSYVLGQDVVTVSNAGTSDEGNLQNGSINGNGGIMLCGTDTPGGAMLFHNTAVNWTCSNMTIDGNKDNVTHTDACIWFMGGADITFENAVIRNFRTSAAERMAVTNVGGTVTFDNVEFSGNENTGENSEKFGEYTDIYSAPWGDASIVLKGATKAKIYYVSGNIDVSGLSEGCDISVKADQADGYEYLKGLVCDNEAVSIEYDDENMTVTFTGTTAAE